MVGTAQDEVGPSIPEPVSKCDDTGCPVHDRGPFLSLADGKSFYFLDPQPEDIDIRVIASALAKLCRYGGHCREFYSVAEHSIYVAQHCSPENALWGLLHDASEGLGVVDLPRSVKIQLPKYHEIEERILHAVAKKYSLPWPIPEEIKEVDNRVLATEKKKLMPPNLDWGPLPPAISSLEIEPLQPYEAEEEFLELFYDLYNDHRRRLLENTLGDSRATLHPVALEATPNLRRGIVMEGPLEGRLVVELPNGKPEAKITGYHEFPPAICEPALKHFDTGAVRSKDREGVRYDLITPIGLRRVAETYAEGAKKYSDFNWEKGMPITDLLNHAIPHIYLYLSGDRSEDHLAHAAWNLLAACHSEELWPHLNTNLRGPGCAPPKA